MMPDLSGVNQSTAAAPPPPPRPAPPPPPQQQQDRVLLSQPVTDGARLYTHQRELSTGNDIQTWTGRNGATYELTQNPRTGQQSYKVEIPPLLIPAPVSIEGQSTPQGPKFVARIGDNPQGLQADLSPDNKIVVGVGTNGTLLMFDPNNGDVALGTTPEQQQGANGQPQLYQFLTQTIHANGNQSVVTHKLTTETPPQPSMWGGIKPPVREQTYILVDDSPAGPKAYEVHTRVEAGGRPKITNKRLDVQRQGDYSYVVTGSDFMGHFRPGIAPPWDWQNGANRPPMLVQTFTSNPAMFSTMAAAAGPIAAAAAQAPFVTSQPQQPVAAPPAPPPPPQAKTTPRPAQPAAPPPPPQAPPADKFAFPTAAQARAAAQEIKATYDPLVQELRAIPDLEKRADLQPKVQMANALGQTLTALDAIGSGTTLEVAKGRLAQIEPKLQKLTGEMQSLGPNDKPDPKKVAEYQELDEEWFAMTCVMNYGKALDMAKSGQLPTAPPPSSTPAS